MWTYETFRTWLLRVAAILILIVPLTLVLGPMANEAINSAERYGQEQAGYACADQECTPQESGAWAAYSAWLVAMFTGGLLIATIALFFVTAGLFWTALRSIESAKIEAKASRDQALALFTAERRPWLQVSIEVLSDMRATAEGIEFDTRFTVTNVGLSPAFNIRISPSVGIERARSIEETQREEAEKVRTQKIDSGDTLFPAEFYRDRFTAKITKSAIDAEREAARRSIPDLADNAKLYVGLHPFIYGTVRYQFQQGGEVHQTGFVYRMGVNEDERIPQSVFAEFPLTKDRFNLYRADCGFWAD